MARSSLPRFREHCRRLWVGMGVEVLELGRHEVLSSDMTEPLHSGVLNGLAMIFCTRLAQEQACQHPVIEGDRLTRLFQY